MDHVTTCAQCGAVFTASHGKRKYCSDSCDWKAARKKRVASGAKAAESARRRQRRTQPFSCHWCGHEFMSGQESAPPKYCSLDCQRAGVALGRVNGPLATGIAIDQCPCGTLRVRHRQSLTKRNQPLPPLTWRCSAACTPAPSALHPRIGTIDTCTECGTSYTVRSGHQRFCTARCKLAAKAPRHRARKRKAHVAPVSRRRIYERDRWTCQLCNKPVDKTKVAPHPLAPTIDHILPLAAGGTHEPSNTQCAHFACNSRKGDRVNGNGEQLRLIG